MAVRVDRFWKEAILLAGALFVFFGIGLGHGPYLTPTEARYIEIPREMAQTGDWITPRLNGVKFFEKPPLFYWIQAVQIGCFGTGEFSGRFWTMLLMIGLCLATQAAGAMLFGRMEGVFAGLALGTSLLGFALSRIAQLDVPLSFFMTCCLFAFLAATRESPGRRRDLLLMTAYGSAALAVLTKGLIGAILPAMVVGSWIMITGRWQLLRQARLLPGLALFLAIALPWHVLAEVHTPEFFRFYFIREHFERYLSTVHGRFRPWWYFLAVVAVGFIPWSACLFQALRTGLRNAWRDRVGDGAGLYLALWIGLLLAFFSCSSSKLIPYILPIFPPIAVLLGKYLAEQYKLAASRQLVAAAASLVGAYALLIVVYFSYPSLKIAKLSSALDRSPQEAGMAAAMLGVLALALSIAICITRVRQTSGKPIIVAMLGQSVLLLVVGNQLSLVLFDRFTKNSIKPLAVFLKSRLKPQDELIAYRHYYHDLPLYLDRSITVAEVGGELAFGAGLEPATRQWIIGEDELWRRWRQATHTVYVLMRQETFNDLPPQAGRPLRVLMEDGRNVLITNESALASHDQPPWLAGGTESANESRDPENVAETHP